MAKASSTLPTCVNPAIAAAAAEIHALINSKPESPTKGELAAIIARTARLDDDVSEPWVRMAFVLMGLEQRAVEQYLRDVAQGDDGDEAVGSLLDGLGMVQEKFAAIGSFADAVLARLVIASDAIVAKEEDAARHAGRVAQ